MKGKMLQILREGEEIQEIGIPEGKTLDDLLEDVCVLEFKPEDLCESEDGKRPYLKGRFGFVDKATANKRVYPRNIMLREVNRILEDMHAKGVYGELDHPCLTDSDFRVLTSDGWKEFRDIRVGDKIWSRKDGHAVLSTVRGIVDEPYDGDAYKVKGRSIDAIFTPAHKMVLNKRPDRCGNDVQDEYVTISDIAENPGKYSHYAIPNRAQWFEEKIDTVVIPGVSIPRVKSARNDVSVDLKLDAKVYAAFLGIYLSEGFCSPEDTDNYIVNIYQKNEWSKRYIYDEVLSKFPKELEWHETDKGYALSDARLYFYLKKLGDVYSRHVPEEAKNLGIDCLNELIFWFANGRLVFSNSKDENCNVTNGQTGKQVLAEEIREDFTKPLTRQDVFSVSKRLIDDLHECLVRSGRSGSISCIYPDNDYQFAGRTILAANKVPLYQLHIEHSCHTWMDPRFISIEKIKHAGNIYCLTVDNGNFYMEKNGYSFWTGNSDGKTKFSRVSHFVTDGEITEDGEIRGKIEFIPGTINGDQALAIARAGGRLGVSSRGFGSTAPDSKGNDVVQEDYKLVTWDIVADPANAGAHPDFVVEHKEAQKMDLDRLKKEHPELVEAIQKETTEAVESEARTHAREALREEFEGRLQEEADSIREEAVEEARGKLLEDPEVAGSATAIERVKEIVAPFILSEDESNEVARLKKKIVALEQKIADQDEALTVAREESDELSGIAKELGYHLYLERELSDNAHFEQVMEMLGDVSEYDTLDQLKDRVEEISEALSEQDKVTEDYEVRISQMEKELNKITEERDKALSIGKQFGLRAYVERKIADNPRASQLREFIGNQAFESREDVDKLVESFTAANPPSEEYEKIRNGIEKRGQTLPEDIGSRSPKSLTEGMGDVAGVPINELRERAERMNPPRASVAQQ